MAADTLQRQARALGDPTRHSIFEYIDERHGSVTVAELKTHFGLNHTTIRQHLSQLCDAGLLVESQAAPTGPGRPRRLYALSLDAHGGWTHDGPYEKLSRMLLDVISSGRSPREVGLSVGCKQPAPEPGCDAVEAMTDEVTHQGFAPRVARGVGVTDLVLTRCPFVEVAESDPGTVCELHRGLAEGLAESLGGLTVTDFVPRPARRAGCRIQLSESPKA